MLRVEEWMDIRALSKEGHSIKAICRLTGFSRNTVRRSLREAGPRGFRAPERASCLDPFKAYAKERFEACGLSASRMLEEIRPMGYAGSLRTLRRYLESLRPEQERLRRLTVRFETPPGKQAQADWAYCGRFPDAQGRLVPVYAFVMVLSFSRMLYDEPLAREQSGALTFLHADGLGSVVKESDAAGAVTFTRRYDAWGNLEAGSSMPGYAFTGREWDPGIGLYYYRARYYDPKAGRFISEDPIGLAGGINLYRYVASRPTVFADPSGTVERTPIDARWVQQQFPQQGPDNSWLAKALPAAGLALTGGAIAGLAAPAAAELATFTAATMTKFGLPPRPQAVDQALRELNAVSSRVMQEMGGVCQGREKILEHARRVEEEMRRVAPEAWRMAQEWLE